MRYLLAVLVLIPALSAAQGMAITSLHVADDLLSAAWSEYTGLGEPAYYVLHLYADEAAEASTGAATAALATNEIPVAFTGSITAKVSAYTSAGVALAQCSGTTWPMAQILAGEDYWLPDWVERSSYTGYAVGYTITEPYYDDGNQQYKTWPWADLEPTEGNYDFSTIQADIDDAIANGYTLQLRVQGSTYGGWWGFDLPEYAPDWLFIGEPALLDSTCYHYDDNPTGDLVRVWDSGPAGPDSTFHVYIPAWRPEIRTRYNAMIRALGDWLYDEENPQRADAIGSAYVHGISAARGEEMSWWWHGVADTLGLVGALPDTMRDWLSGRMDAFADAFGEDRYKVAWVGSRGSFRWQGSSSYRAMADTLINRAWDKGLGNRTGNIEQWWMKADDPAAGSTVDAEGYVTVHDTIPPIANIRYLGDENENIRGGEAYWPTGYRFSMLVSLHRHLRWLWTSDDAEGVNLPLSDYWRLAAGKNVYDSPDAWAYLSETPTSTDLTDAGVIRNVERWLYQRDVEGGITAPVDRVERNFHVQMWSSGIDQADSTARRTDLGAGTPQPYIYFDIDDRFADGIYGAVLIKVEYRDVGAAEWAIEYMDGLDVLRSTPLVHNEDSGDILTATFRIEDGVWDNGLGPDMDFRIATSEDDVTVRWVRVVRWLDGMPMP